MCHTRSSSYEGYVSAVYAKSAQVASLVRDDRGQARVHTRLAREGVDLAEPKVGFAVRVSTKRRGCGASPLPMTPPTGLICFATT